MINTINTANTVNTINTYSQFNQWSHHSKIIAYSSQFWKFFRDSLLICRSYQIFWIKHEFTQVYLPRPLLLYWWKSITWNKSWHFIWQTEIWKLNRDSWSDHQNSQLISFNFMYIFLSRIILGFVSKLFLHLFQIYSCICFRFILAFGL